jgi:hypothetical protein
MRQISALFVVAAALGAGCPAAKLHRGTLDSRASFDLRCPQEQLKVTQIDYHTAGVDGCGQRVTYIYNDNVDTWVMNSPPGEPPPPPAGAPAMPPPAGSPPPPSSSPPPAEPPH